jgi:Zn-finger protein
MKRPVLNKKIRFEIFKRDNFTCQYCGQKAPNVKLNIIPNDEGSEITVCQDCNLVKDSNMVTLNLSIPEELNEDRKKLNITWKEVISAGILALKNQPLTMNPSIEENIKLSVKHLSEAWKLIKGNHD